MEDHVEMGQHSRSNVAMLAARGTFIAGTWQPLRLLKLGIGATSPRSACTIYMTDKTRRAHCTVKLGKDNSPSSMMDHLRIHHRDELDGNVTAS
jgi:hypothetical protein